MESNFKDIKAVKSQRQARYASKVNSGSYSLSSRISLVGSRKAKVKLVVPIF
ncbi:MULTISPECIES: hypothetical protein [Shewanella]|uniref:hypothetical protein n=1 Tax=Shewanella TaxID=22 RepID=UPI00142ED0D8|nr:MULTISPECIES: hypothetical protein [Shewanella]